MPIQTTDEVAAVDHERGEITQRIDVGSSPYGATSALVGPCSDPAAAVALAMARLGLAADRTETTYCIGNCACGHRL